MYSRHYFTASLQYATNTHIAQLVFNMKKQEILKLLCTRTDYDQHQLYSSL